MERDMKKGMCCLASLFLVDSFGAAFCSDDNVLFKICVWNVAKFGIRHRSKWKRSVILSDFWCWVAFALGKMGIYSSQVWRGRRRERERELEREEKGRLWWKVSPYFMMTFLFLIFLCVGIFECESFICTKIQSTTIFFKFRNEAHIFQWASPFRNNRRNTNWAEPKNNGRTFLMRNREIDRELEKPTAFSAQCQKRLFAWVAKFFGWLEQMRIKLGAKNVASLCLHVFGRSRDSHNVEFIGLCELNMLSVLYIQYWVEVSEELQAKIDKVKHKHTLTDIGSI